MSKNAATTEEARHQTGPENRSLLGMIRRVVLGVTSEVMWQTIGVKLLDDVTYEVRESEVFPGIGFFARPHEGGDPEACQVFASGAAELPMIVATRDERTRKQMAGKTDQGETVMFNHLLRIWIRRNNTMELGGPNASPAYEFVIRGETLKTALDLFLSAMQIWLAPAGPFVLYINGIKPIADPLNAVTPAMVSGIAAMLTAVNAFKASLTNSLSTVVKVQ